MNKVLCSVFFLLGVISISIVLFLPPTNEQYSCSSPVISFGTEYHMFQMKDFQIYVKDYSTGKKLCEKFGGVQYYPDTCDGKHGVCKMEEFN